MSNAERAPRKGLNFRLLEIFGEVVRANGMTGAAAALGLTQSAVSQAVANLETAVGARLIDRGTRPLKLTLAGEILRRKTFEIMDKMQDIENAINLQFSDTLPLIRLTIANTVASTVGPHFIKEISDLADQWVITSGFAATRLKSLMNREVDFIITVDNVVPDDDMLVVPILEEPYIVVVPAGMHGSLDELAGGAPFIRYGAESVIAQEVDTYLHRRGLVPPSRYRFDTSDVILAMVAESIGWTISTPLSVLKSRSISPRICCLPLEQPSLLRRVSLVTLRSENDEIAHKIADAARAAMEAHCLPALRTIAPWAQFATRFAENGRSAQPPG